MKLNKSQLALIAHAKERGRDWISVERFWGQGPEGGRISGGNREMNAARKLVDDGLATRISHDTSMTCVGNGYHVHNSILRVQLNLTLLEGQQ